MKPDDVIRWVIQNGSVIEAYATKRSHNAPYEAMDYMQEAFMAALKAYRVFPDITDESFERVFWRLFKNALNEVIPISEHIGSKKRIRSNESASIPSSVCDCHDDALHALQDQHYNEPHYSKFLFLWARPALTTQEANVLSLSLGLSDDREGILSEREIASKLKISRRRVQKLLEVSISKIVNLIEETDAKKVFRMMFTTMKESFHDSPHKGV